MPLTEEQVRIFKSMGEGELYEAPICEHCIFRFPEFAPPHGECPGDPMKCIQAWLAIPDDLVYHWDSERQVFDLR